MGTEDDEIPDVSEIILNTEPLSKIRHTSMMARPIRGLQENDPIIDFPAGPWTDSSGNTIENLKVLSRKIEPFKPSGRAKEIGFLDDYAFFEGSDSTHQCEGDSEHCPMCQDKSSGQPKIVVDSATMDRLLALRRARKNRRKRDRKARK